MKSRGGGSDIDLGLGIIDDEVIIGLAVIDQGECGDNAYYTLYNTGLLEIYGTGRVDSGDWDKSAVVMVDMSDALADMHTKVFEDHTALVSAKLPNEMNAVHGETFKGCTSLASIELSENITHINLRAFQGCTSLASITIHATTPPALGTDVFDGCTALTAIYVPAESVDAYKAASNWSTYASLIQAIPEVIETGTCGTDVTYELWNTGLLEISGTGAIAQQAFLRRQDVENVVINNGITSIGEATFFNCTSLTGITIPDSVTSIDRNAFDSCTSLTDITIPDSVTSIGSDTFVYCTSLTDITVLAITPPTVGNSMFWGCDNLTHIYVPAASVNTYKAAIGWDTYARLIQAIPSGG